jgi:tetratricopeptide (TPR) repeat protein
MNDVTLVGYHFPKTGGTSIHAHAALHLGVERHYPFGHYADTRRLHNSLPLLAEFDDELIRQVRFVYGHQVSFSTLALLPDNGVQLFAVCRHPVTRFISAYKHNLRYGRTATASARDIFNRQRPSPFAHEIMTRFAPLADPNAHTDEEKLISILQCMRFLLTTETLNEQSADLFGALGLPPFSWKRRAHGEAADLADLTANEVIQRDHLDMLVHSTILGAANGGDSDRRNNPFGYRPERLAAARRALANEARDRSDRIEAAYFRLFDFHVGDGRIHATKVLLEHSGRATARAAFAAYCNNRSIDVKLENLPARNWCYVSDIYGFLGNRSEQRRAAEAALAAQHDSPRANYLVGREAARSRELDRAIRLLQTATELNPTRPEVWLWLARVHRRQGDVQAAENSMHRARVLNPDSKGLRRLSKKMADRMDDLTIDQPEEIEA